jgi:predicted MFS family arabinose efflux permease
MGVSACLMAPLTLYRHRFAPALQLRANSWMLMTGSMGMLASTLPAQWLLPRLGWRGLFALVAGLLAISVVLIRIVVPADRPSGVTEAAGSPGYEDVFRSPAFLRLVPAGFFSYGGMIAMQSLWIGPWLTKVGQRSPGEAATGLFLVNGCMLLAFLGWGLGMPRLLRSGWTADRIMAWGWVPGVVCLAAIVWSGADAGAVHWAAWCVLTSVITLSQPAIAQSFPPAVAGRALSAFNLVVFLGVFAVQWGLGLLLDALMALGIEVAQAYRLAFALYLVFCVLSFGWMRHRAAGAGSTAIMQH